MKSKEDVFAALDKAQLSKHRHEIEGLLMPSVRLTSRAADEAAVGVGASKLGGLPDLAADQAWPLWKGLPMSFVAQINLSQMSPYDVGHLLPKTGLLLFFYDSNQQDSGSEATQRGQWQIIFYTGDPAKLQRTVAPATLPAKGRFKSCALDGMTEFTLPLDPSAFGLMWDEADSNRYSDFMTTYPSPEDRKTTHHRLLGYTDQIQDDMHTQVEIESRGLKSDQVSADITRNALHWQLLLQIDSDEKSGMNWANNGMLYFWIAEGDLKAQKFDNVWLVMQSE